ncbi:MAG: 3-hydroxybutyryl-CoA dehydrogenase [Anaerolineaceae bacterium]|nr:3-hydroxybutyryl-CoA dehydrogenase [Anaerolineaceae bacterium]
MKVVIAGESPFVEQMGQLCTQANHDTVLYLVEDFTSALHSGYSMPDAAGVDVAIELHNESAAAKEELLAALGAFIPPDALLLTSALATSTTQAAAWIPKPGRVVGFGIVPPLRKDGGMIELAVGLQTAESSLVKAKKFVEGLGYETAVVADGPGLVRARTVCCLINEAASALLEGIATPADIDQAMKLGTNYPYGPLEWADYLGLDTVLGVMNGLFSEWGEDRYRPSPLLKRMVLAGKYGRKTGEGFFKYES